LTSPARALPRTVPFPRAAAALLTGWFGVVLMIAALAGGAAFSVSGAGAREVTDPPSALARRDIPPRYLTLYAQAARAYGLDWAVLAAIGKVECDHGRAPDSSCTRTGATNAAAAGGPMQFLAATWAQYGRDGNGDGSASRWDPADAIYSAAAYLVANGAPREMARAIFAYNHAHWYVAMVEAWAARYRGSAFERSAVSVEGDAEAPRLAEHTTTPVAFVEGERARLAGGDRRVALIPAGAPLAVQAMVVAGNELQSLPYGPAGHPDPRGATEEDCSSSVNYVLYRAGVRPISEIVSENPLAQDYVSWGAPGPGRWVTIYATAAPVAHVFIVIAGLRLDTSHNGTDVGPNSREDGPRWRIFDRIPTWARWSVRHPPGL